MVAKHAGVAESSVVRDAYLGVTHGLGRRKLLNLSSARRIGNERPICKRCSDSHRDCTYERETVFIVASIEDGGRCEFFFFLGFLELGTLFFVPTLGRMEPADEWLSQVLRTHRERRQRKPRRRRSLKRRGSSWLSKNP